MINENNKPVTKNRINLFNVNRGDTAIKKIMSPRPKNLSIGLINFLNLRE